MPTGDQGPRRPDSEARAEGGGPSSSANGARSTPSLHDISDGATQDTLGAPPGSQPEIDISWPAIPGYRILGKLGQGGMGVVYKAEQLGLKRIVALKMVSVATEPHVLKRFHAEAAAVARLRHPNIVQIHDIGEHAGAPFFSMEYVAGGTLSERLSSQPQPIRWAARLIADLADAVQAAHDVGIVHRDLKPGNILLQDAEGRSASEKAIKSELTPLPAKSSVFNLQSAVPKITDFGVAKQLDATMGMTMSGVLIGTPGYMAPEQAEGRTTDIGPPADIHALGVILYRMVTGQMPFQGTSVATTLATVATREPTPPYRLNPRVHRDLATICLKCLRKSPGQRYASAGALAADLRRFLSGEPIEARPVGPLERLWNWAVRRPAAAVATLVSLAVVLIFLPGWWWYQRRLADAEANQIITAQLAAAAEQSRIAAVELAESQQYFALVNRTRQRNERRPPGWTWAGLKDLRQAAALSTQARDPVELATEAARCLAGIDLRPAGVWADDLEQTIIAFSSDGKLLAVADYWVPGFFGERLLRLFDAGTGKLLRTMPFSPGVVSKGLLKPVPDGARSVAFTPDGDQVLIGSRSGWVYRWHVDGRTAQPHARRVLPGPVDWLLVLPDGKSIIVASSQSEKIARWDMASAKPAAEARLPATIRQILLTPDGARLTCEADAGMQFLDVLTLQPVKNAPSLPSMFPAAFDPTGEMVVGDQENKVAFLHVPSATVVRRLAESGTGIAHDDTDLVRFNRDASLAVSLGYGDDDRLLILWGTASGRVLARMPLTGQGFADAAFHPTRDALIVANDGKVELFEIGGLRVQERIAHQPLPIRSFDFLPDGNLVTSAAHALRGWQSLRSLSFWEPHSGRFVASRHDGPNTPDPLLNRIAAHPTAKQVALLTYPELIEGWDYATRQAAAKPLTLPRVSHLAFDRGGRRLWTIFDKNKTLACLTWPELARISTWQNVAKLNDGTGELYSLAVGEKHLALGSRDSMTHLLRVADAKLVIDLPGIGSPVRSLAISRDETLVASGFQQGAVRLFRIPGGELVAALADHDDSVEAIDFSPDGALLATGSRDGAIHLYRVGPQAVERLITFSSDPVAGMRFHPDGRTLTVLHRHETALRLWRLDRLRGRLAELQLDSAGWEAVPLPP